MLRRFAFTRAARCRGVALLLAGLEVSEVSGQTPPPPGSSPGWKTVLVEGRPDPIRRWLDGRSTGPALDDALVHAAYYGPVESVELVLARGARADAADARGWTALLAAIKGGQPEIVARLLAAGANPNATDRAGRTSPLLLAAGLGRATILPLLIEKGAKADARPPAADDPPLVAAVRQGQADAARALLAHGAGINVRNAHGETALLVAARFPDNAALIAEILLPGGADVNAADGHELAPLAAAASRGDTGLVRTLLDHGARLDPDRGTTALREAVQARAADLALALMGRGARVDRLGDHGDTLLHVAVKERVPSLIVPLLERGVDVNRPSAWGETPLMLAVEYCPDAIEPLLAHGADVSLRNKHGRTVFQQTDNPQTLARLQRGLPAGAVAPPVRRAQGTVNAELLDAIQKPGDPTATVKALLDEGAETHVADAENWPVIVLAARHGQTEVVRLLLDHGADANAFVSEGHWSALLQAAAKGHADTVDLLLARGARLAYTNRLGEDAAAVAADRGHDALAERLRAAAGNPKPANPTPPPPDTKTGRQIALGLAAKSGDAERVRVLLAEGVDPNWRDPENGWTALLHAAKGGHAPVVQILLAAGANVNACSHMGCPALAFAAGGGYLPVVEQLLNADARADLSWGENQEADALLVALEKGHLPVIQRLFRATGWDAKTGRTVSGDTYLMVAAKSPSPETVAFFLGKGADPNAHRPEGHTALMYAVRQDREENVRLLLKAGADLRATARDEPDAPRFSALDVAYDHGHREIIDVLKRAGAGRAGADADRLVAAVWAKNYELVSALLAQGVSADEVGRDGDEPLRLAVRFAQPGIVGTLLRAGAGVATRDGSDRTVLQEARDLDRQGIDALLRQGALTAEAAGRMHTDIRAILELLQRAGARE